MHSGDAASYRRCWDEMAGPRPCPCEKLQKLYRGSNSPASAERNAGPRHVLSKCK
jgi:hypothetical protein